MMPNAAERLSMLDQMPAVDLCGMAQATLDTLVSIINEETVLLRAGRVRDASALGANKTQLAQEYVGLSRAVQRQIERLRAEAPAALAGLQSGHERLAMQMAENLRVIATARSVTEDLLTDVAQAMAKRERPHTYAANGQIGGGAAPRSASGVSLNRSL